MATQDLQILDFNLRAPKASDSSCPLTLIFPCRMGWRERFPLLSPTLTLCLDAQ